MMFWRFMFFFCAFPQGITWLARAQEQPMMLNVPPEAWMWFCVFNAALYPILGLWALFRGFE